MVLGKRNRKKIYYLWIFAKAQPSRFNADLEETNHIPQRLTPQQKNHYKFIVQINFTRKVPLEKTLPLFTKELQETNFRFP